MTRLTPTWRPSPHARALLTTATVAVAVALVMGRADLVVLAVPLLWAAIGPHPRPVRVDAECRTGEQVCFEGEHVPVEVDVDGDLACRTSPALPPALSLAPHGAPPVGARSRFMVRAVRWGRWHPGPARVLARTPDRLWQADLTVPAPELTVYPRPAPRGRTRGGAERAASRIGEHTTRHGGHGVEFAGVRPWAPGDPQRRINWPATARTGRLQITTFAEERQLDLVLCLDAHTSAGPPGDSTLDRILRGAAGLARAHLRDHDRVGVVTIGGSLRWIGPEQGERQFHRIAQTLIDARRDPSFFDLDLARIPRTALPALARVVVLSPLVDPRTLTVLADLRQRGHTVSVIDPLATEPRTKARHRLRRRHGEDVSRLALHWWRLHREGQQAALARLGITITHWDGHSPLALPPLPARQAARP